MSKLVHRWEVPEELTWDLKDLYPNIKEVYRDLDVLMSKAEGLSGPKVSDKRQ